MASKIHRYKIAEESPLLPGIGPFPEPDFWSNEVPIMAICEPNQRSRLQQGDWVFHVPKKDQTESGPDYQVTGILKVQEKKKAVELLDDPRFGEEWIRRFKIDLSNRDHLLGAADPDKNTVDAQFYVENHIIGDPDESHWFGRTDKSFQDILDRLNIDIELSDGRVRDLQDDEADQLVSELKANFSEVNGTPPNAVFSTTANSASDSTGFISGSRKR